MGSSESIAEDLAAVGRIDAVAKILKVTCDTTGMGFAAVARVTPERWVACAVEDRVDFGLEPGGEFPFETGFRQKAREGRATVIIDHADAADHQRGFRSYISAPIAVHGEFFGALCAADPKPARLSTPAIVEMVELFAELIGEHLEQDAALLDAKEVGQLRDQFIAVLGHDLKNPLAAVDGGARLLLRGDLDESARTIVGLMQGSVRRMTGLIDNVLDFARGRLGGGFDIEMKPEPALADMLEQVVAEMRAAYPNRQVRATISLHDTVSCDARRVAQLFSNLLSNAFSHGAETTPVTVSARSMAGVFELSVANLGQEIPEIARRHLFQPFSRAAVGPHRAGLGLGLYIASEIARAHGGTLEVSSDARETVFTFRMASRN